MAEKRDLTRWPIVEGYCDRRSYRPGDAARLHCATRGAEFRVEVRRLGSDETLVADWDGLTASDHPVPPRAWEAGCGWPPALEFTIGTDWVSGFYLVEFLDSADDSEAGRSQAFFVVMDAVDAPADALFVISTSTYNAYNYWGGGCLYTDQTKVSFDRPLERGFLKRPASPFETDYDGRACNIERPSDPTHARLLQYQKENQYPLWTNSAGWHNWERRFARWAEDDGWDFSYATSEDLHQSTNLLDGRSLLITIGHDEYWSWEMRDTVEQFVRGGGKWLVLSGDTCTWQIRYEGSEMICYKSFSDDPMSTGADRQFATTMWSDPAIGRPETELHGLTFTRGGYHRVGLGEPQGTGGYEVHQPEHWAFDGLDLEQGSTIGSADFAVGYEANGCALDFGSGLPVATGVDGAPDSLEVLATAPVRLLSINGETCEAPAGLWASLDPPGDLEEVAEVLFGDPSATSEIEQTYCVMASMTFGKGEVFNGGSADWAYGLDRDAAIQRVTANILARFGCPRR